LKLWLVLEIKSVLLIDQINSNADYSLQHSYFLPLPKINALKFDMGNLPRNMLVSSSAQEYLIDKDELKEMWGFS